MFGAVIGLLLGSCTPGLDIRIAPSTQGNHRPQIQITPQVTDNGAVGEAVVGTIDSCSAMGGCAFPVNVTRYTKVRLLGKVVDKIAGVKSVTLTIKQSGVVQQSFQANNAIDASGKVPSEFGFIGSDGAGGFGVLDSIDVVASSYYEIEIDATNFEGNSNKLIAIVTPHDPVQAMISVTPTQIEAGGEAVLKIGGSPHSEWIVSPSTSTKFGEGAVAPLTDTTYSLTVRQPFPISPVGFPDPPPATSQKVFPVFKTVSASLAVRPVSSSIPNPAELQFHLLLQAVGLADATYGWKNTFGLNTTGQIVAIRNLGPRNIELIKTGKSTTDCFQGTDATVPLSANQSTSASNISNLYGNAQYPREIGACAVVPPGDSPPPSLALVVTYTH